jgi:hypothetical protein
MLLNVGNYRWLSYYANSNSAFLVFCEVYFDLIRCSLRFYLYFANSNSAFLVFCEVCFDLIPCSLRFYVYFAFLRVICDLINMAINTASN